MIKKIFLQLFATWIGWLFITLILSVVFGVLSYRTIDEESQFYLNCFIISIIYPVGLILFQIINPFFVVHRISWMKFLFWLIAPIVTIRWALGYESIVSQNHELLFWIPLCFMTIGTVLSGKQVFNIR